MIMLPRLLSDLQRAASTSAGFIDKNNGNHSPTFIVLDWRSVHQQQKHFTHEDIRPHMWIYLKLMGSIDSLRLLGVVSWYSLQIHWCHKICETSKPQETKLSSGVETINSPNVLLTVLVILAALWPQRMMDPHPTLKCGCQWGNRLWHSQRFSAQFHTPLPKLKEVFHWPVSVRKKWCSQTQWVSHSFVTTEGPVQTGVKLSVFTGFLYKTVTVDFWGGFIIRFTSTLKPVCITALRLPCSDLVVALGLTVVSASAAAEGVQPVAIITPTVLNVQQGQRAELRCTATGIPTPAIEWIGTIIWSSGCLEHWL